MFDVTVRVFDEEDSEARQTSLTRIVFDEVARCFPQWIEEHAETYSW